MLPLALSLIRIAAWMVPSRFRAGWRDEWLADTTRFAERLTSRPAAGSLTLLRHVAYAWRQALSLRQQHAVAHYLVAVGIAVAVVLSGGLARTRVMIWPELPEPDRLVYISGSGLLMAQRITIAQPIFQNWRKESQSFVAMAGYVWEPGKPIAATGGIFDVLGGKPERFPLRLVPGWQTLPPDAVTPVAIIARLKPGVSVEAASAELERLSYEMRVKLGIRAKFIEAEIEPYLTLLRVPLITYGGTAAGTFGILAVFGAVAMAMEVRRSRTLSWRYWGYYFAKAFGLTLFLAIVFLEFTDSTSTFITGGRAFFTQPFSIWFFVLGCAAILWYTIADQRTRCRSCLLRLEKPVRIGWLGAILFHHSGTETICQQGHGALYTPEVSSDYVQTGGWTRLDTF